MCFFRGISQDFLHRLQLDQIAAAQLIIDTQRYEKHHTGSLLVLVLILKFYCFLRPKRPGPEIHFRSFELVCIQPLIAPRSQFVTKGDKKFCFQSPQTSELPANESQMHQRFKKRSSKQIFSLKCNVSNCFYLLLLFI